MNEITTSVEIDAPPETVWDVLTDFPRYPEWNPRMRITGRANVGARLQVAPGPESGRVPTFRPRVLRAEHGRELAWLGHLYVKGLFDGEHRFTIEDLGDGRSRLDQSEQFSGVLVGIINRFIGADTEEGFHQINAALKTRAEAIAAEESGDTGRADVAA